jgi:hypothetical protein
MTYYTITEQLTVRTDIDWFLKAVLINIVNKLEIPKEKLNGLEYTFSVSNVAIEMGINTKTTFVRFSILEKLKAIKKCGTKITTHGEVVLYHADKDIINQIVSGGITFEVKKHKRKSKKQKTPLLCDNQPLLCDNQPLLCDNQPLLCDNPSKQMVQANGSKQMVAAQIGKNLEKSTSTGSITDNHFVKAIRTELNAGQPKIENWNDDYFKHTLTPAMNDYIIDRIAND